MSIGPRLILIALIALAAFGAWKLLSRSAHEVVVLHTGTVGGQDYFATLWIVDDRDFAWIRAESPGRRWLAAVRQDPDVTLRRRGRDLAYRASVWDSPDARAYVDRLFRAKYGLADAVRAFLFARETVPIRLEKP